MNTVTLGELYSKETMTEQQKQSFVFRMTKLLVHPLDIKMVKIIIT